MKFNTKDVSVPGTGVSKSISYGILKLKLMDIVLTPSANGSGNTKLQFLVEDDTPVEEGYEYEGVFGKRTAQNKSGRIQYEVPFKLEEDNAKINSLLATFADLANKTNCREELDALGDKDQKFEDYLKDPLKYIQFILILVVGYLWIDNKMNYQKQITNCSSDVVELREDVKTLTERLRKTDSTLARTQGILSVLNDETK